MPSAELHNLTLAEAARLISVRKLSPVEYTEGLLARTEALEPQLSAFITRTPDIAMAAARTAEAEIMLGNLRGPLHGIPFPRPEPDGTAGILSPGHSLARNARRPGKHATSVACLHGAAAVLMRKRARPGFARGAPTSDLCWRPGRRRSETPHFPGRSSSASGATL